jgi:hypothetical protein
MAYEDTLVSAAKKEVARLELVVEDVWNRFTGEVLARAYLAPVGYALSRRTYAKTFRKEWLKRFDV